MLTLPSHVHDGRQYKYPCSRLYSLLNKQCLPVLGHRCRTYTCQISRQWDAMSVKAQSSIQFFKKTNMLSLTSCELEAKNSFYKLPQKHR